MSYRIGGNFRGMKFSRISRMIPASRTYNHEHFMHRQCKLLDIMPPWGRSLQYRLEPVIKQFLRIKSIQIHEICLRSYMPNNIAIALHCHCEHIVSVSPFFYASQGFSWCCIPQIFIHVISTNATIENKCNFIHNGTC